MYLNNVICKYILKRLKLDQQFYYIFILKNIATLGRRCKITEIVIALCYFSLTRKIGSVAREIPLTISEDGTVHNSQLLSIVFCNEA